MNAYGNSTRKTPSVSTSETKTASKVTIWYTYHILTLYSPAETVIASSTQWYSRRRDIRHSPLPYCIVKTAVIDLLSDWITPAGDDNSAPILITPLTDSKDTIILPTQPAVIQHLETTTAHTPPNPTVTAPRRLSTHITLPSAPRRNATTRSKRIPHNISSMNAATIAIR
jgi:hypothetical protein